jgi:hypothetical protein
VYDSGVTVFSEETGLLLSETGGGGEAASDMDSPKELTGLCDSVLDEVSADSVVKTGGLALQAQNSTPSSMARRRIIKHRFI